MVNLAINLPGGKVVLTSSWRRACQEHWLKCRVEKPRAGMESRVEYRVGQKCEWVQNGQRCDTRRLKNETLTRLLSFTFRPLFFLYSLLVHFLIIFSPSRKCRVYEIFISRGFRCFLPWLFLHVINEPVQLNRAHVYAASTLEARRAGRARLFWKLR